MQSPPSASTQFCGGTPKALEQKCQHQSEDGSSHTQARPNTAHRTIEIDRSEWITRGRQRCGEPATSMQFRSHTFPGLWVRPGCFGARLSTTDRWPSKTEIHHAVVAPGSNLVALRPCLRGL